MSDQKRKASGKVLVKSAYFSAEDLPIVEAVCREGGLTVGQLATMKAKELSEDRSLVLPSLLKELRKVDGEMVGLVKDIPAELLKGFKEKYDRIRGEHKEFSEAQVASQFATEVEYSTYVAAYLGLKQLSVQARGLYSRIQKINGEIASGSEA